MTDPDIPQEKIDMIYQSLSRDAEMGGYHLNPDMALTGMLIKGLIVNENRYGYRACPCRLASGVKEEDIDIICPCDYRDPDLIEFHACYCALYVSEAALRGEKKISSIPERRPLPKMREKQKISTAQSMQLNIKEGSLAYPVWRCKVCGYLCARDSPPEVCPVCKAKKERFERFL